MKWNNSLLLIIVLIFSQLANGQSETKKSEKLITITGKVRDLEEKPVEGATLYIDNLKTNCITKRNGSYRIKVSPSAINLEVRSPEYESNITPINGQKSIDFVLKGLKERI